MTDWNPQPLMAAPAPRIRCDLDGVLADFDTHHLRHFGYLPNKSAPDGAPDAVNWAAVRTVDHFYLSMPPMEDAKVLWDYIKPYKPTIVTGVPASVNAADNDKRAWCSWHLGREVEVICCRSKEKAQHCKPGDILIDDWTKYRHIWEAAGGIFIVHTSAVDTIRQLQERGL